MVRSFRALALFLLLFALYTPVSAEPLVISFDEMVRQAPHIVLARFEGAVDSSAVLTSEYWLQVTEVIRGELVPGRIRVKRGRQGMAALARGQYCMAFLTKDMEFDWYGIPRDDRSPQSSVWDVAGFYDFNAYLVTPSVITLDQLRNYLQEGQFHYALEGPLVVYDGRLDSMVALPYRLSFRNLPDDGWVCKTDLPFQDFVQPSEAYVSAGFGPDFSAAFSSNVSGRRMEIHGMIGHHNPETDVFETQFRIVSPLLLNNWEVEHYLHMPRLYHPWYGVDIQLENGKTVRAEFNLEYGRIGNLVLDGRAIAIGSVDTEPLRITAEAGDGKRWTVLVEELPELSKRPEYMDMDAFLRFCLAQGELRGVWQVWDRQGLQQEQPCILQQGGTGWKSY